jgi:small-conductance mechanosensitive channel
MNILEGTRRMEHAGRRIVLISLSAFVILIALFEVWVYSRDAILPAIVAQGLVQFVFGTIPIAVFAMLVGAVLWVAGWILAGFAKHDPS